MSTKLRPRLQRLWRFLEVSGTVVSAWPPEPELRGRRLLIRNLAWSLSVANLIVLIVPLAFNVFLCENNIVVLMKSLAELNAATEALLNLILCRLEWPKLQSLLKRIQEFLESADDQQGAVLEKYLDRYSGFYRFAAVSYIMAALGFSCGPLFTSSTLPGDTWYPFPVETTVRRSVLYANQALGIFQIGLGIAVHFMVAMLLVYCTARLEMLKLDLGRVQNEAGMNRCARNHQEIIRFVDETQNAIRYLLCKTNATIAFTVIFGAFPLVYNQTMVVVAQFAPVVIGGCETLYMFAWPADDLREISEQIATAAYSSGWVGGSSGLSKSVLLMVQRSQRPIEIRMGGLFPVLSLEYYSNFLKTISSYFMTMRTVVDK